MTCGGLARLPKDYINTRLDRDELWGAQRTKIIDNVARRLRDDDKVEFTGIIDTPAHSTFEHNIPVPLLDPFITRGLTSNTMTPARKQVPKSRGGRSIDYFPNLQNVTRLCHLKYLKIHYGLSDETLKNLKQLGSRCLKLAKQIRKSHEERRQRAAAADTAAATAAAAKATAAVAAVAASLTVPSLTVNIGGAQHGNLSITQGDNNTITQSQANFEKQWVEDAEGPAKDGSHEAIQLGKRVLNFHLEKQEKLEGYSYDITGVGLARQSNKQQQEQEQQQQQQRTPDDSADLISKFVPHNFSIADSEEVNAAKITNLVKAHKVWTITNKPLHDEKGGESPPYACACSSGKLFQLFFLGRR